MKSRVQVQDRLDEIEYDGRLSYPAAILGGQEKFMAMVGIDMERGLCVTRMVPMGHV